MDEKESLRTTTTTCRIPPCDDKKRVSLVSTANNSSSSKQRIYIHIQHTAGARAVENPTTVHTVKSLRSTTKVV